MHARENLTLLKIRFRLNMSSADPEYFTGVFRGIFKFAREGGDPKHIMGNFTM